MSLRTVGRLGWQVIGNVPTSRYVKNVSCGVMCAFVSVRVCLYFMVLHNAKTIGFSRHPGRLSIRIVIFSDFGSTKSSKNKNSRAALGRPAIKLLGALTSLRSTKPRPKYRLYSTDKTITTKASHYKTRTNSFPKH